jgi:hypothetical protein
VNIKLASFTSLPLQKVLAMDLRSHQITQKMDGRTAVKSIGGFEIIGELMRDDRFYAFDMWLDKPLRRNISGKFREPRYLRIRTDKISL